MKTKKELRKEILSLRDAIPEAERKDKSHMIAKKIIAQKEFLEADKVLLFASYSSEVETSEIFQTAQTMGKAIYYPKVMGKEMEFYLVEKLEDLQIGYRGIQEPQVVLEKRFLPQPQDKICVVMPGAVFDAEGNRIGYGGGYYDKFLQKLETEHAKENLCKIAIAFACQMVGKDHMVQDELDIKVDYIVTENQIFFTSCL